MVGKIDIQKVVEHEDGSATVTFECDDEAKTSLHSLASQLPTLCMQQHQYPDKVLADMYAH